MFNLNYIKMSVEYCHEHHNYYDTDFETECPQCLEEELEEEKSIYNLKLHEFIQINNGLLVQRVPSGWNYIYTKQVWDDNSDVYDDEIIKIVFVPFDYLYENKN